MSTPDLRYAATVHNGIDLDTYPYRDDKEDFLVYIGRANPDKGPVQAIEVARRAGLPLAMIVKRNEPFELAYWDEIVAPMLTDDVEVYERVTHEVKADLLARARAMVFPIEWPEPFGLVMIEAMACGTPVVACPRGAATEIVADGVTGFLRSSIEDLAEAVGRVGECSPTACRERVVEQFSAEAWSPATSGSSSRSSAQPARARPDARAAARRQRPVQRGSRPSRAAAIPSRASSVCADDPPHRLAHAHGVDPGQVPAPVRHLLDGADRERRASGRGARASCARGVEQVGAGHDRSGEADLVCPGRIDAITREQELERRLHADPLGEPHRADDRRDAEAHLGHAELRVVGRDHEVARATRG